jgi:hypothetical protein
MSESTDPGHLMAVLALVVGLVLVGLAAPVATSNAVAQQSQPETDNTVTRVDVFENGSARWTIQIRTRLDTAQRVEEYAAYRAQFRNSTAQYLDPFRTRIRGVVANAENATGRQMRATNFTASIGVQEVPRRWGVVTYRFTWTNVASQQSDRVAVGDIFQGGFFIAANDTLQIVAPADYRAARIDPEPDSQDGDTVTWEGREDFADARPRVVFVRSPGQTNASSGSANGSDTPADSTSNSAGDSLPGPVGPLAAVGAIVVLAGLAAVVAYLRRDGRTGGVPDDVTGTQDGRAGRPPSTTEQASTPEDTGSTGAIMTDEERVLALVEANGGRMRQAAVAEELDWSPSKTSRVVGRMADDGSVEKLRLGRENLVALGNEGDEQ